MNHGPRTTPEAPEHPPTDRGQVNSPPAPKQGNALFALLLMLMMAMALAVLMLPRDFVIVAMPIFIAWLLLVAIKKTRMAALAPVILIFGPVLMSRQRIARVHEIGPLDSLPQQMSDWQRAAVTRFESEFTSLGFLSAGMWRLAVVKPVGTSIAHIFHKPGYPSIGMVQFSVPFQASRGSAPVAVIWCSNAQRESVFTYNGKEAPPLPLQPGHRLRLPRVQSIAELVRLQDSMVRRFAPGARAPHPGLADLQAFMQRTNAEDYGFWHQNGHLRLDSQGEYRLSPRAVIRVTLRAVWPMSNFSVARDRGRTRDLLREIGESPGLA